MKSPINRITRSKACITPLTRSMAEGTKLTKGLPMSKPKTMKAKAAPRKKAVPKMKLQKSESKFWCLTAHTAHPDYKRPSASFEVHHFKTKLEAIKKERELKVEFCCDRGYDEAADAGDDELQKIYTKICNSFYDDGYMSMEPFSTGIKLVTF